MVDHARQMLDELMGRNRNLDPSEAPRKINWDDPDFCQYYVVKFCPHDLFVNTRADLGPCARIHDDEAKELYIQARPSPRKRQYEDDFLRFCNTMLNDVDRKIQKGRQRLQLMQRDQPISAVTPQYSKHQEQLNNLNGRIKKLLSEAEEAGIRGDVDQAQDLMKLCEQLKEERDLFVTQHADSIKQMQLLVNGKEPISVNNDSVDKQLTPKSESESEVEKKIVLPWTTENASLPEKQMEVCEVCGAFLIVGDAQQRIEDHLMGKQHLGYSRLRKAIEEIHERRQKEREEEEKKRREERSHRSLNSDKDRRRDFRDRDYRDRDRERDRDQERDRDRGHREHSRENRHSSERHRHHRTHRRSHSRHRDRSHERSKDRSRSRSRY